MSLLAQTCCVPNPGPLTSGGALGDRVQTVYTVVFWASVVLGGIVAALLVYAFFRFRRRADDDEPS
ncbi:MAG: hypothetical protein E6J45_10370, partial [Chloroflexi bacterium]